MANEGDVLTFTGGHQAFRSRAANATAIEIDELALTTHVLAGPYDTRGVNALGLFVEVSSEDNGTTGNGANVFPLTRTSGRPWMAVPALEIGSPVGWIAESVPTYWPVIGQAASGAALPTAYLDSFVGLLEETVVVVDPRSDSPTNASATLGAGDGAITFTTPALSDAGNLVSIEYRDPGISDSPLSISSDDGWAIVVNLETDGMGAIVTTAGDIAILFGAFTQQPNAWLVAASDPIDAGIGVSAIAETPLTSGDGNTNGVNVTVRGSL